MRKTFNDAVVKFAIKFKIDVLKLELNTLKELSETIGAPSTIVGDELEERINRLVELADDWDACEEKVDELEERLNRLVELADGSAAWDEKLDELQEEISERFNHLVELADGSDAWINKMDDLQDEIIASPLKERRGY